MEISDDDLIRFWIKVETGDIDKCWIWVAGLGKDGYGRFKYNGFTYYAHIFSYLIHKGSIEKGLFICHQCDNPKCVNPGHLFLGTAKANNDDKEDKGRGNHAKGENINTCKLTEKQVLEIREKYSNNKYTFVELAKEYNVKYGAIQRIIKRKTWKHI